MLEPALLAAAAWLLQFALPWRPWSTRERIEPTSISGILDSSDRDRTAAPVTVLIPARNEAESIGATLDAVLAEPGVGRVIVVDDGSTDATFEIASARDRVRVIRGAPTPPGWSGKLWAQQQGLGAAESDWLLLLDADIRLDSGMLPALLAKANDEGLDQVSVMATLPTGSVPEKLMLPAFVFFFRQLYPFSRVNRAGCRTAAAAGGCVLVRRDLLARAGAFAAWRGALIDDCELARRVQSAGGRIWLGLSHGVHSLRRHPDLASILDTIRRTAYVQLSHSPWRLLATVTAMLLAFAVPPTALVAGLWGGQPAVAVIGLVGWLAMAGAYLPQVRFHRLAFPWAAALPLAGLLFLYATLDSARRHHFGAGAGWKGRRYPATRPLGDGD